MNYLVVFACFFVVSWGTRVICRWLHDRRVPRHADVRAIQSGFVAVSVIGVIAVICDATDGGRPLEMTGFFWEFFKLLSIVFVGLVIMVLRNSSLPRAGKGEPAGG